MPEPKTLMGKCVAAVEALAEPEGASRVSIKKFVSARWSEPSAVLFKKALAKAVEKGELEARGTARFAIPGLELAPRPGEDVVIEVLAEGSGEVVAERGDSVNVSYVGTLEEGGSEFDRADSFDFTIDGGEVIKGWDKGVKGMKVGEKRRLVVPPKLGYGKKGSPPDIPGSATLIFVVTLLAVE